MIVYVLLIIDWSGAKLSKSLYVQSGAYQYLKDQGMDYLVSYQVFKDQKKDLGVVFDEVEGWVAKPYKLLRTTYSMALIDQLFKGDNPVQGVVGKL